RRKAPRKRANTPIRGVGSPTSGSGSTSSSRSCAWDASGSATATGSGSATATGSGSADTVGAWSSLTVRVTRVPHPEVSSFTVPLAAAPSQATAVSGSSLVMRISPNAPRCRASDAASLHSAHSSGADLTSVRLLWCSVMPSGFARAHATPPAVPSLASGSRAGRLRALRPGDEPVQKGVDPEVKALFAIPADEVLAVTREVGEAVRRERGEHRLELVDDVLRHAASLLVGRGLH